MSSTVIEMPKVELETRAQTVVDEARALAIVDQESLNRAGAFITERIKPLLAEANEVFDKAIAAAYQAHKEVLAAKASVAGPLVQAEAILKSAIGLWIRKQDELRRAEERRLREEEERRQAEIREQQIEEAEQAGADPGLIEAICSEPIAVAAPVVAPTYQKPAGISTRETWSAKVTSIRELCRAVAEGKVPETYVAANMTALNARARADKGLMNIPGVKAAPDTGVSARRF